MTSVAKTHKREIPERVGERLSKKNQNSWQDLWRKCALFTISSFFFPTSWETETDLPVANSLFFKSYLIEHRSIATISNAFWIFTYIFEKSPGPPMLHFTQNTYHAKDMRVSMRALTRKCETVFSFKFVYDRSLYFRLRNRTLLSFKFRTLYIRASLYILLVRWGLCSHFFRRRLKLEPL